MRLYKLLLIHKLVRLLREPITQMQEHLCIPQVAPVSLFNSKLRGQNFVDYSQEVP